MIDIATGQQPIFNDDKSVALVFNGEVYNYLELMDELRGHGYVFRTKSDSEAIVRAWEHWGEDCVHHLRGMFAFMVHDRRRDCLFMARDRMGVKPLHYAVTDDGWLLFGSELKSIVAHGGLRQEIDPRAIEAYFALGYVPDPGPSTSTPRSSRLGTACSSSAASRWASRSVIGTSSSRSTPRSARLKRPRRCAAV